MSIETPRYLYIIKCDKYYKIGISYCIVDRLTTIQVGNPFDIKLIGAIFLTNAKELEKELHNTLINKRIRGEWFELSVADLKRILNIVKEKGILWQEKN